MEFKNYNSQVSVMASKTSTYNQRNPSTSREDLDGRKKSRKGNSSHVSNKNSAKIHQRKLYKDLETVRLHVRHTLPYYEKVANKAQIIQLAIAKRSSVKYPDTELRLVTLLKATVKRLVTEENREMITQRGNRDITSLDEDLLFFYRETTEPVPESNTNGRSLLFSFVRHGYLNILPLVAFCLVKLYSLFM